ncbi:MAG: hypothetical protein PVH60_10830, partial [Anaerolineales bacterium]
MFECTLRKTFVSMGFIVFVTLSACNMPTPTPVGPVSEPPPLCSLSDLTPPQTLYPEHYTIIVETTP